MRGQRGRFGPHARAAHDIALPLLRPRRGDDDQDARLAVGKVLRPEHLAPLFAFSRAERPLRAKVRQRRIESFLARAFDVISEFGGAHQRRVRITLEELDAVGRRRLGAAQSTTASIPRDHPASSTVPESSRHTSPVSLATLVAVPSPQARSTPMYLMGSGSRPMTSSEDSSRVSPPNQPAPHAASSSPSCPLAGVAPASTDRG